MKRLLWWRKDKDGAAKEEKQKVSRLTINMTSGYDVLSFTASNYDDPIKPWMPFVEWFGGQDDEVYTLKFNNGQAGIARKFVRSYMIKEEEE